MKTITNLWIYQGRYRIPVEEAAAGNWVLIEGVDGSISKTATLVPEFSEEDSFVFRPLQFDNVSVIKIATEPLNPSDLPKMVEAGPGRYCSPRHPTPDLTLSRNTSPRCLGRADIARHAVQRVQVPCFLSKMSSYDMASNGLVDIARHVVQRVWSLVS